MFPDHRKSGRFSGLILGGILLAASAFVQAQAQSIRIGVPTALQLQVGLDAVDSMRLAVDEINAKGGVNGRKLELVVADETEKPETGIAAIKKLIGDEKVDVLIGGHASSVTLAQLPHISRARIVYLGAGAASPAITQRVKQDYENYKYIFRVSPINANHQARALADFISGFVMGELGLRKIAIIGENIKWVQDLVPILRKGATDAGADVRLAEFFDTRTSDFSPLLSKIKDSGAQFLVIIFSRGSSDLLVKQWYDARLPIPIGGIDVKSTDADFYKRVDGKSISEITGDLSVRAPITAKTIPYWDAFVKKTGRGGPAYSGPGAYDAVHVYAEAVRRARTTEADAVIKELEKIDYVGVLGRIQFDDTHDVKAGPGFIQLGFAQWQDKGESTIVWPKELRTGRATFPPWIRK
jgi:branched-chain amino acid transport system substrate-binding protein